MRKHPSSMMAVLAILMLILAACTTAGESPDASADGHRKTTVGGPHGAIRAR